MAEKANPISIQKALKGVDYPASKDSLVQKAKDSGAEDSVMKALQDLPDREFEGPSGVTEAIFK